MLTNDSDALTLTTNGQPGHGAAAVSNGLAVCTPGADFAGADSFTYTAADGKGGVSNVVRHLLQWAKCDKSQRPFRAGSDRGERMTAARIVPCTIPQTTDKGICQTQ